MPVDAALDPDIKRFAALPETVRRRIAKVRLLLLDVDGVLTDGGLVYGPDGSVSKRFDVQDGLAVTIARHTGVLRFAVITGHDHPCVAARLRDVHLDDYFPGYIDKRESYETVRQRYGLAREEVAFVGDDWIDIPVMRAVGVPLAVANAQPETKAEALYVTRTCGGHGAVREVFRLILYCKEQLDLVFDTWMKRYTS